MGIGIAPLCRPQIPVVRLFQVGIDAAAAGIHIGQRILRLCIALVGRFPIPIDRPGIIPLHALAVGIAIAETVLRGRIALVGEFHPVFQIDRSIGRPRSGVFGMGKPRHRKSERQSQCIALCLQGLSPPPMSQTTIDLNNMAMSWSKIAGT